MPLTRAKSTVIESISASQILPSNATNGDVLTFSDSTQTWVPSAVQTGSTQSGIVAWVNFDGKSNASGTLESTRTNTNRFLRASSNIASVLRNGTGDYTITFSSAIVDADYIVLSNVMAEGPTNSGNIQVLNINNGTTPTTKTTTQVRVIARIGTENSTAYDPSQGYIAIIR